MVVLLKYVSFGGDPSDNLRTKETLTLGSTVKQMVTSGSETLIVVSAFVVFSKTIVLFVGIEAFG